MKDKIYKINQCRLCGRENLKKVITLSNNPIGDRFFKNKELALSCELHDVVVMMCKLDGLKTGKLGTI